MPTKKRTTRIYAEKKTGSGVCGEIKKSQRATVMESTKAYKFRNIFQ
jgi:hypothetical protein